MSPDDKLQSLCNFPLFRGSLGALEHMYANLCSEVSLSLVTQTLLIVEDDPDLLRVLALLLQRDNLQIETAQLSSPPFPLVSSS